MRYSTQYVLLHYPTEHRGERLNIDGAQIADEISITDGISAARAVFLQRSNDKAYDHFGTGYFKTVIGGSDFFNHVAEKD
tara:strand:- start:68 stop:307 length:240 start_codon:yes stop_codon:yes gene_type:complete